MGPGSKRIAYLLPIAGTKTNKNDWHDKAWHAASRESAMVQATLRTRMRFGLKTHVSVRPEFTMPQFSGTHAES